MNLFTCDRLGDPIHTPPVSTPATWAQHLTLGEELLPNKISVRVDERFFTVSKTVAQLLQKLIDQQTPTDRDVTATLLRSRLSVGQARLVADNLISYLTPEQKKHSFFRQVRRGFIKFPLYAPNQTFIDFFRGRVVNRVNGMILAAISMISAVICVTKAPHLPTMTSLNLFSGWQLFGLWLSLTLTTIIHEFGHAIMAAHYGVRPRSMGIALFLLQPAGFADVSNGWLSTSSTRIMIALGGFIFQTLPLFLASLFWLVTDQSIFGFYCLSSVGIMILNTIPLVRTDGYWVLINVIKDPHLSTRTASLALMSLKAPKTFLNYNQTQQTYATFGLASITYTIGMYLIGIGTIMTRFPEAVQRWSPIIMVVALAFYFCIRLVRQLLIKQEQQKHPEKRENFASD